MSSRQRRRDVRRRGGFLLSIPFTTSGYATPYRSAAKLNSPPNRGTLPCHMCASAWFSGAPRRGCCGHADRRRWVSPAGRRVADRCIPVPCVASGRIPVRIRALRHRACALHLLANSIHSQVCESDPSAQLCLRGNGRYSATLRLDDLGSTARTQDAMTWKRSGANTIQRATSSAAARIPLAASRSPASR